MYQEITLASKKAVEIRSRTYVEWEESMNKAAELDTPYVKAVKNGDTMEAAVLSSKNSLIMREARLQCWVKDWPAQKAKLSLTDVAEIETVAYALERGEVLEKN